MDSGSFLSWRPFFLEFSETFRLCPSLNKCILLLFLLFFTFILIIILLLRYRRCISVKIIIIIHFAFAPFPPATPILPASSQALSCSLPARVKRRVCSSHSRYRSSVLSCSQQSDLSSSLSPLPTRPACFYSFTFFLFFFPSIDQSICLHQHVFVQRAFH